jgi:hypothetical protein
MRAARVTPDIQVPNATIKGPQLVPAREKVSAQVPVEAIARADPHPFAIVFIVGGIALIGALTFVGSLLTWLLVRNTGVNWMFQGN